MLAVKKEESEDRAEDGSGENLTVKVISLAETRQLGDAIIAKYKKAFDLLKDK